MIRVAIVGAGISGLALGEALLRRYQGRREVDVVIFEKSSRPGGHIQTELIDEYLCESGPNGFLDSAPETFALIRRVGLEDRLQPSGDAARHRFIYAGGRLHEVPSSPITFLRSRLLSWSGKARVLAEPWAASRADADESIYEFAERRLGREAADVLVDSLVSGIFAGDPRELSLRACFPKMWQLESEHGGLIRALYTKRTHGKTNRGPAASSTGGAGTPAGRLTSFHAGMGELILALADQPGEVVRTSSPVVALRMHPAQSVAPGAESRFSLDTPGEEQLGADVVVLTGPARDTAVLLRATDPVLSDLVAGIPTAPVAVVCLGFRDPGLRPRAVVPRGYGFLIPRRERARILGVLFESTIYPGRAPAGCVLLRVMVGGARDPEAVELSDGQLVEVVLDDLRTTLGIENAPEMIYIFRHRLGIPQYVVGHLERLRRIDARLAEHPGLFLGGHFYRGAGVNACVTDAAALARRVADYVDSEVVRRHHAKRVPAAAPSS